MTGEKYIPFFVCDLCGQRYPSGPSTCYYLDVSTEPPRKIAVGGRAAWCHLEQTVVIAEHFLSLEQLDRMLLFLAEHRAYGMAAPSPGELGFFRMQRELNKRRKSAPRCLGCGALEFEYLDDGSGGSLAVEHPHCGGVIRHAGLHIAEWDSPDRYYSTEGIKLHDSAAIHRAVLIDVGHDDC